MVIVAFASAVLATFLVVILPMASFAGQGGDPPRRTHLVRPGETLWKVALSVDDSADTRLVVDELMRLNRLPSPTITPGQSLLLP